MKIEDMFMKNKTLSAGLLTAAMAVGLAMAFPASARADVLPNGVFAGDKSLSGMTAEEANQEIDGLVDQMGNQKITLKIGGQTVDTTAKELGLHRTNQGAVEKLEESLSEGNLIKQYLTWKDIDHNHEIIPLETAFDDGKVSAFLQEECASFITEPKDASIERDNDSFVVTPSVDGQTVDLENTKKALMDALALGLEEPVMVTAAVTQARPRITTDMLSSIHDLLGTFSTDFSSSGNARATNLRVGAGKINAHVLLPGETLSGYDCMHPFTNANGYATAAAYENGQVVDSVGGGVCQISTTLYNAALGAELDISQRQNHSMIVTYVKPSQDAAIAGTFKDLKLTNNYSTPIYVEGYTSGRTLTFSIYGKETRSANRTVKYVSETLGTIDPGPPKEEVDPAMAPGTRKKVQSSHRGYKSRLWKYVYENGVEQSREILHTDTYNASPAIFKVGPAVQVIAVPEVAPTLPVETQPAQQPTQSVPVEGEHGGPGVKRPQLSNSNPDGQSPTPPVENPTPPVENPTSPVENPAPTTQSPVPPVESPDPSAQ